MSLQDLRNNPHYQISYAKSVMVVALEMLGKINCSGEDRTRLELCKDQLKTGIESLREWDTHNQEQLL